MTKEASPQITLNDFVAVVNMIDVCTERGSFKGNELLTVGTLREKMATFVRINMPQENPPTTQEEEGGAQ